MIIVIDAYNVLKQAYCTNHIVQSSKQLFIKQLGNYSKKKGHAVIVVFDGGSFEWPDKEKVNGIQVVHSGIGLSADDWIKNYIELHRSFDILLVSTDRELNKYVKRFGIESIDSVDFYGLLQESVSAVSHAKNLVSQKAIKISEMNMPSLDELMEQASKKIVTKIEDVKFNGRTSKAHTPSKKERQMLQKLKKL